jgi:hypothetical protein
MYPKVTWNQTAKTNTIHNGDKAALRQTLGNLLFFILLRYNLDNLAKSYMKRRETRYSYQFMQGGNHQEDQNAKASNSLQANIKSAIVPKVPKPKWLNKLGTS